MPISDIFIYTHLAGIILYLICEGKIAGTGEE